MIYNSFNQKTKETQTMSLSSKEFKDIYENAFKLRYEDNDDGESELRCFECGEKAELKKKSRKWRIRCSNKHKWKMSDYLKEYIYMRDGITRITLNDNCNIDKSPKK